jgi:hypothetical protein
MCKTIIFRKSPHSAVTMYTIIHVDANGGWGWHIGPAMLLIIQLWWWYVSLELSLKLVTVVGIAKGGTVMEARAKQCNVAVQCEGPEFLTGLDLDLAGSNRLADQKAGSSWNQGTIDLLCHNFQSIGGWGPFEDPNFAFLTV